MAKDASGPSLTFSTSEILFGKSRRGIAILLGLMLAVVPSRSVVGQNKSTTAENPDYTQNLSPPPFPSLTLTHPLAQG